MGGWLAVLPLFVIVAAGISSAGSSSSAARLQTEGVEASATITGKFEERRWRPGVRSNAVEPDHVLQFSYSSGSISRGELRRGRTFPRRPHGFGEFQPGAVLRILYDAEQPALAFWAEDLGERATSRQE